jgi:cell division septal protein FtsQ
MRSQLRIVMTTLLLAVAWTVVPRAWGAVADLELFRIRQVEVQGLRFAQRSEIVDRLRLTPRNRVWEDPAGWAGRVEGHPLVKQARVRRRVPGTLVIEVVERQPVALAATPTLVPVDAEGKRLPVDPSERRLDLPVLAASKAVPDAGLLPRSGRTLAAEVGRLEEAHQEFFRRISEVAWEGRNTVVARWTEPKVDFLFPLGVPPHRLQQGMSVLADALSKDSEPSPRTIDLRFADQVVVRRTR